MSPQRRKLRVNAARRRNVRIAYASGFGLTSTLVFTEFAMKHA